MNGVQLAAGVGACFFYFATIAATLRSKSDDAEVVTVLVAFIGLLALIASLSFIADGA